MTAETKKDFKYYIPLFMGFIIMMIALIAPPLGTIPTSAIYAGGCFLILCATIAGLDLPKFLHEINELKRIDTKEKDVKN